MPAAHTTAMHAATRRRRKCKCGAYFTPIVYDESLCYDCQCEREWNKSQYELGTTKKERKEYHAEN
jgi:hypothetical protein